MTVTETRTRGTTNGNDRGSSTSRRARRAWIMEVWASDKPNLVRCYRCGFLLHNPDAYGLQPKLWLADLEGLESYTSLPLSVDRIKPGCQGGTYRRDNIRPACGPCNSETGGSVRRKK